MADDQFREKTWEEQQAEARRIMAEQEEALAAAKAGEAESKAAAAEEVPPDAAEEDRRMSQRFSQQMAMARAQANMRAVNDDGAEIPPEVAKIDKEISMLRPREQKMWIPLYLMLTVAAAVCDLLQLLADLSLLLSLLASALGVVYSGARYICLHTDLKRTNNAALEKDMVSRTLISGAISLIPIVDFLPEQTAGMIIETAKRYESMRLAEKEIIGLQRRKQKLIAAAQESAQAERQEELQQAA